MDEETPITPEDARTALLAGGSTWREALPRVSRVPGTLHRANLVGEDLGERDLSDLDLSHGDFFQVRLTRANLKKTVLDGAELAHSNLVGAALYKACLTGAILQESDLSGADLSATDCKGADFRGAKLCGANLSGADLRGADLSHADLSGANMVGANVTGAKFQYAQFADANVSGLNYGGCRDMIGLYLGVRGLDQTYGNALFVRDARDEDYIDTLHQTILAKPPGLVRRLDILLFRAWGLIDHGRSLAKVSMYAALIAITYGLIYTADMNLDWGIMDYSRSAQTVFTPFYYSVVTYTTLGYGDVTADSLLGEVLVISEVIVGYFTLGLLLAILANTIARRS